MSDATSQSGLVMELAEEFLDRYRKGERPPLKEYIDRHPELAAEMKKINGMRKIVSDSLFDLLSH